MSKQNGNFLLEIILVIAVSSVLIMLAVRYFAVVEMNTRVAEAISKIDILSRAGYEWMSVMRESDFSNLKIDTLKSAQLINVQDASSPWGGEIDVSSGLDKNHIRISVKHISPKACMHLQHHLNVVAYTEISKQACKPSQNKTVNYWGEF